MFISIVMPCLNERATLGRCIEKAKKFIRTNGLAGEVIVADNGSSDGSRQIGLEHGVRVVDVAEKGYGMALRGGMDAANGEYIIMGDADDSYDFLSLHPFIEKLKEGNDLVVGNRFKGGIEKGAMPWLHRYLGNPLLSFIGRLLFRSRIGDFHCGLRGLSRKSYRQMKLTSKGMEFASEMVIKASMLNMRIAEVPTTLACDGRGRAPHLNTWRDGWRHLCILVLNAPQRILFYLSIILFLLFFSLLVVVYSFLFLQ